MAPLYLAICLCILSFAAEKQQRAKHIKYEVSAEKPEKEKEDPEAMVVLDPLRPWDVVSVKDLNRLKKLNKGDMSAN